MLWIDVEGERANSLVAVAERERVERLAAGDVDHLEVFLIGALDVEAGPIGRKANRPRDTSLERDLRRQFLRRFLDDRDSPGVGPQIDSACSACRLWRGGRLSRHQGGGNQQTQESHCV